MTKLVRIPVGAILAVFLLLLWSEDKSVVGFQLSSSSHSAKPLLPKACLLQRRHGVHVPSTVVWSSQNSDDYDYYEEPEGEENETDEEEERPRRPGAGRRRPLRQTSRELSNEQAKRNQEQAQARHEQALKDPTLLTNVQFEERDDLHPATKRAITQVLGLQVMTEIQEKTYAQGTYNSTYTYTHI